MDDGPLAPSAVGTGSYCLRMGSRFDPWRELRRCADVAVVFGDPGPGAVGSVDYASRTITLAPDLLQRERRTTLTHELIHLERGPVTAVGVRREEATVELEAARRLIAINELINAAKWTDDVHELALELGVDEAAMVVRLQHLADDERALLARARLDREG